MATALMWSRTDVPGSEFALVDDGRGLHATGAQHAVDPVPYRLDYELWTDARWATTRLVARARGDGWIRELELVRSDAGWTCEASASGGSALAAFDGSRVRSPGAPGCDDLRALQGVLDVDIGGSPLTNSLPVRRLGMLAAPPGRAFPIVSAWVLPPTLEVIASPQTYTAVASDRVRYGDAATGVEVHYDGAGWVSRYPGLAERVG